MTNYELRNLKIGTKVIYENFILIYKGATGVFDDLEFYSEDLNFSFYLYPHNYKKIIKYNKLNYHIYLANIGRKHAAMLLKNHSDKIEIKGNKYKLKERENK